MLRIKPESVIALIEPATTRGISVQDLVHRLIDTIAKENLCLAILDDQDEIDRIAG